MNQSSSKTVKSIKGIVTTPHPLATKSALKILEKGGSAIDAAIAANATLAVLLPDQCGLGGDLFALIYDPDDLVSKRIKVLNGSGNAPNKLNIAYLKKLGYKSMPQNGPHSITVPGAVQAWGELSKKYGLLAWDALFEDAYEYASLGFKINHQLANNIKCHASSLIESDANYFLCPNGIPLKTNDILIQTNLANTLISIMENGWQEFYKGSISFEICEKVKSLGGMLEKNDFIDYKSEWVEPISTTYRNYEIYTAPPNSPGIILLSALDKLKSKKLDNIRYQSKEFIFLLVEIFREVLDQYRGNLGDPRFDHKEIARSEINLPQKKLTKSEIGLKGDTIALSVLDKNGLGVSLIQSVYHDFGSGVFVEPVGIFLQNRGASFSFDKDNKNYLISGKRPLHTLMPVIVLKDKKLSMLLGTRGGAGQPQTIAQILLANIDYGYLPQEAMELPRWIFGSPTSAKQTKGLILESRISKDIGEYLEGTGISVQFTDPFSVSWMGCAQMIRVDCDNTYLGGADPRGGGLVESLFE